MSRQRCFCRKPSGLDFAGTDSERRDIFDGGRRCLLDFCAGSTAD